jgi:hypothetical protein
MNQSLQQIIALLMANTLKIESSVAELTRATYYDQYGNWINTGQFVPILYFNINDKTISINNTTSAAFTNTDIFTATDWSILNQIEYPFTASLTLNSPIITNVTTALVAGQVINGKGFPKNTTVLSGAAGTYTLSANATINANLSPLTMTIVMIP